MRRDGLGGWKRHRREFHRCAGWTREQIERHSLDLLRGMLEHAFRTVPYYRGRWSAIGFAPSPDTSLADLRRLPLLLKDDIRERKAEMLSNAVPPAALHLDYTGGTTGTQTSFYRDNACRVARVGRQRGILERSGYRAGQKRALIWGAHADLAAPAAPLELKRRIRDFASADAVLCCTVMRREDLLTYHRRLQAFEPAVLYGYPNAIEEFARFIEHEKLSPVRVARVFCTAEAMRDSQRTLFRRAFEGEVFDLYCSREHGCVGFECERHSGFHVDAGSVFVEILRDGRAAAPGESGDIVITDLLNRAMPIIRYVTGDVGAASTVPCDCGCALPTFSRLEGRVSDLIYRPDGTTVAGIMLDDLFMDSRVITHAQFIQEDVDSLDVRLVVRREAEVSADVRVRVIEEVRAVVGPDLHIRIHFVDDITRNPRSGKFQLVICRVPADARQRSGALSTAAAGTS